MSYWMAVRRRLMIAALAKSSIDVAALAIAYTGAMTDQIVTMGDGKRYRLLTLTSSGTLTVEKPVQADVWMCGGGGHGAGDAGGGGGGGYVASAYKVTLPLSSAAVVGAASGASSFAGVTANPGESTTKGDGGSGGSGGGAGGYIYDGGTGAGITTYPFGDTSYFSGRPHSGGGGGGGYLNGSYNMGGGYGGSNGDNGESTPTGRTAGNNSQGGNYGGGRGGYAGGNGSAATFYGGGGGAGGYDRQEDEVGSGCPGYQGVIYVRIPLDQKAA